MSVLAQMFLMLFVANIVAWFQIQGQFMDGAWGRWLSKDWVVVILGIPIGWMLWKAAFLSYQYFGAVWNIRMIGFGMGTFIFGIMIFADFLILKSSLFSLYSCHLLLKVSPS